jgi:nucleoside-diphosphate-sugar epimerase
LSQKVFITGISGCVGHYLFDELAKNPEYELYLLTKDPKNLKFDYKSRPNLTIVQGRLENIEKHSRLIRQMDVVIHIAAAWGSTQTNYDNTLKLFNLLDPAQCHKVIYFSTASILDENNQPVPEAEQFGTHYIRSKYRFYKELPELKIYPNVITLFPTWVLGGDKDHPISHASKGIIQAEKWFWLIRFFTVNASFHFIHARDIARIVKFLLENQTSEKNFVLGNKNITVSQFLKEVGDFFNKKVCCQIPISLPLVRTLAFLTGHRLHSWDLFCFKKRHFRHKTVNAEHFGLSSDLQTVEQILNDLKAV